jgi:hypothetical protein
VAEHFAYGGGDLWFRGKLAEGRAGWTLIENNGRERLVLPRGSATQAMPKFREGVEYIVIMRQGKLKEAHTVEGERRRGDY